MTRDRNGCRFLQVLKFSRLLTTLHFLERYLDLPRSSFLSSLEPLNRQRQFTKGLEDVTRQIFFETKDERGYFFGRSSTDVGSHFSSGIAADLWYHASPSLGRSER